MDDMKLVPQSAIDMLELARKELFVIVPEQYHPEIVFKVSPAMYEITHRKYKSEQPLRAEIAALENRLRAIGCVDAADTEELCSIREKMRQLSGG